MKPAEALQPGSPSGAGMLENLIDGRWQVAEAPDSLAILDPALGAELGRVPLSSADDVDAAVAAARAVQPAWAATSVLVRARAIMRMREVLVEHRDEIAALVTRDMGKTFDDAKAEVQRGIESVEAAIAAPSMSKGNNLEGVARGVDVEMVRQPVGVVAAITPFNFPAMIPLWFLPYAVVTGNAIIIKPSERDPLATARIVELIAGIDEVPKGVVGLVHGAKEAVTALLDHPGIDAVSFVGQASTARFVATRATERGKRVQALGGAKNSAILMPDCDLDFSTRAIGASAFGAAGQRCLAGSVLAVVGDREQQDRAIEAMVETAGRLVVGAGDEPETDICPMVSADARERVRAAVASAESDGDIVLLDGRSSENEAGTYLGATIVEAADPESAICRDELFGPVLAVRRCGSLREALDFINGSRYGNAAMLFSRSGAAAREFRARVKAGMLGVNIGVAAPVAWFPFGGWDDSIDGDLHANGEDAIEFYTRKKVITTRWPDSDEVLEEGWYSR